MSYTTAKGYTLPADLEARRMALLPLTVTGPEYSRAAADGLRRLAWSEDLAGAVLSVCEAERKTVAQALAELNDRQQPKLDPPSRPSQPAASEPSPLTDTSSPIGI
jgi:hypothetical protein